MTTDPYEILAASLQREQELVQEGRLAELAELVARVDTLAASLPEAPPAGARTQLEIAERTIVASIARVEADLEVVRTELGRVGRERATRAAYARGSGCGPAVVDAQG